MTTTTLPGRDGSKIRVIRSLADKRTYIETNFGDRSIRVSVPDNKLDQIIGDLIAIRQNLVPQFSPRS